MGKIIGIDLGTTNSCVAVMDGEKPRLSKTRRRSHHALDYRLHRRWRDPGWPVGQAPGSDQSAQHLYAVKRLIGRQF